MDLILYNDFILNIKFLNKLIKGIIHHPTIKGNGVILLSFPASLKDYDSSFEDQEVLALNSFNNNFSDDEPKARGILKISLCTMIYVLLKNNYIKGNPSTLLMIAEASGKLKYHKEKILSEEYRQELELVEYYHRSFGMRPLKPESLEIDAGNVNVLIGATINQILDSCGYVCM
jgi:hypothetical protein